MFSCEYCEILRTFANDCFLFCEKEKTGNKTKKLKQKKFKEEFKENAYKSKQIPGEKLSHLAWTKLNFHI